jgi:hypothetical protein
MSDPASVSAPHPELRARTPLSQTEAGGASARLLWGDFHNHCAVGLFHHAKGSLKRAIENARSHLDFFAFTGHSQWHDMPAMVNDAHLKWKEGFDFHTTHWPTTKRLIAEANKPGEFVAFLGYEWHSAEFGDRCIIFKDDAGDLRTMGTLAEVEALARETGALLYPHHIGYKGGLPGRGLNWSEFHPEFCPLIEIQSEHGCAEHDRAPYPYITHSNGPRLSANTYQRALAAGLHCGVAAGSDDHLGFPGAYREGVLGVFAEGLTRAEILAGAWRRRTLASTGDRIAQHLRINDGFIGDILPASHTRSIRGAVSGWDEIEKVELLKNNHVLRRFHPAPGPRAIDGTRRRYMLRFEYGWGPWTAFGMPRTADWEVSLALKGAKLVTYQPCFQTAPFDEGRRHSVVTDGTSNLQLKSYTGRTGAFLEVPTNAIVLEIEAAASDSIALEFKQPSSRSFSYTFGELFEGGQIEFMGNFPSESFLLHRLVSEPDYRIDFALDDVASGEREDFYYLRVSQTNNQHGWCSPIWVQA